MNYTKSEKILSFNGFILWDGEIVAEFNTSNCSLLTLVPLRNIQTLLSQWNGISSVRYFTLDHLCLIFEKTTLKKIKDYITYE